MVGSRLDGLKLVGTKSPASVITLSGMSRMQSLSLLLKKSSVISLYPCCRYQCVWDQCCLCVSVHWGVLTRFGVADARLRRFCLSLLRVLSFCVVVVGMKVGEDTDKVIVVVSVIVVSDGFGVFGVVVGVVDVVVVDGVGVVLLLFLFLFTIYF